MKIIKTIALALVVLFALIGGIFFVWPKENFISDLPPTLPINTPPSPFSTTQPVNSLPANKPADTKIKTTHLSPPSINWKSKITKKPFGIYITPENSPISPERFTGWHTGADAEYEDTKEEVAVYAISDGIVQSARRANGYGGVVVIQHTINDKRLLAVYGHLDPSSLVSEDSIVTVGQQIGVLGESGTNETDGERKHLHLGILPTTKLDIRGYVNSADKLNNWLDPLTLY